MQNKFLSLFLTMGALSFAVVTACGKDKDSGAGEEGLEREELGQFTTDTAGVVDVPYEVPEGAVSSLVYCGPYSYDVLATAESITAPGGSQIYSYEDGYATDMRVNVEADLLPVLIPVSPNLDVQAGAYTLRLYVDAGQPATVTCNAVYRMQAAADAATIDINLVFVGVDGVVENLNATSAEASQPLQDALSELKTLWAQAGLEIGTISYSDMTAGADTYTTIDDDTEFGDLLRTVPDDSRTVTFFFVQSITSDDGATILGLSAGPPGTAAVGGTSKSGVIVTVSMFNDDGGASDMARLMAHEGGHFLGLYHTNEKDGSGWDPIDDTPTCNDSNGDGTLSSSECGGSGAENLMWWASSDSATELSSDQGWVVRRSAAVH